MAEGHSVTEVAEADTEEETWEVTKVSTEEAAETGSIVEAALEAAEIEEVAISEEAVVTLEALAVVVVIIKVEAT